MSLSSGKASGKTVCSFCGLAHHEGYFPKRTQVAAHAKRIAELEAELAEARADDHGSMELLAKLEKAEAEVERLRAILWKVRQFERDAPVDIATRDRLMGILKEASP